MFSTSSRVSEKVSRRDQRVKNLKPDRQPLKYFICYSHRGRSLFFPEQSPTTYLIYHSSAAKKGKKNILTSPDHARRQNFKRQNLVTTKICLFYSTRRS